MKEDGTDPILIEALEWSVRMRDDKATTADRTAFASWLARDAAHAAAWRHAEGLWNRFDIAQPEFDRARRGRVAPSRRHLLIAGLTVAGSLGGAWMFSRPGLFPQYATAVGERRTFTLPDGSRVELGSYSTFSTDFTQSARIIDLYRGEGFFDVAADPLRPFVVRVAGGATRALGTKFNVKLVDDLVTVAVSQHAVEVGVAPKPALRIDEGWQVSYGAEGLGKPSHANLDMVEAWRQDRIVFQDVPLRRVLTELERYRHGRILLMDSRIGDIPVTAIFDTGQADRALQTIGSALPIRILNTTRFLTLVYSAG